MEHSPAAVASTSNARDNYFRLYHQPDQGTQRPASSRRPKRRPKSLERTSIAREAPSDPSRRKRPPIKVDASYTSSTSVSHGSQGKEQLHAAVRSPASSRHSRAPSVSPSSPSSSQSPATTTDSTSDSDPAEDSTTPKSLFPLLNVQSIAFEDMDKLVSHMPKSPSRSGRPRHRTSKSKDRHAESKLDWHGRELKEKLKRLQHQSPSMEQDEDAIIKVDDSDESRSASRPGRPRKMSRSARRRSETEAPPVPKVPEEKPKAAIPSIDDIVRKYAQYTTPPKPSRNSAASVASTSKAGSVDDLSDDLASSSVGLGLSSMTERTTRMSAPSALQQPSVSRHSRHSSKSSISSVDSIVAEAMRSLDGASQDRSLHHTQSMPVVQEPINQRKSTSLDSSSSIPKPSASNQEIATYLRSTRLTRLVSVETAGPGSQRITLSLADVGDPQGHPIFVYLGLGCVRYLVALYDELAEAMGLRLICIDRWGLGRSESVPKDKRGFSQWAHMVEAVADHLGIGVFSILAHSAGAPYALATSLRCPERIRGRIHLLAPWVNGSLDGQTTGYKLLKYVPDGLIKTAQAAEWRLQSWKLGKNPSLQQTPVGYDRWAAASPTPEQDSNCVDPEEVLDESLTTPKAAAASLHPPRSVSPASSRPSSSRKSSKSFLGSIFRSSPKSERGQWITDPSASPRSSSSALDGSPRPSSVISNTEPIRSPSSHSTARLTMGEKKSHFDLSTALLRASYSESMEGGTADLLAILERTGSAQEFLYSGIDMPVSIYYGSKDDRVSLASVKSLQAAIAGSQLEVIDGADHSLMTSSAVMVKVFDAIKADA